MGGRIGIRFDRYTSACVSASFMMLVYWDLPDTLGRVAGSCSYTTERLLART